jgi:hypothetical protein
MTSFSPVTIGGRLLLLLLQCGAVERREEEHK